MKETILLGAALSIMNAIVYYLVGHAVMKRPVSKAVRPALWGFAAFWFGLAGVGVASVILVAVNWVGLLDTAAFLTYLQVILAVIMAAIAGLLYYLVVVYTGRTGSWKAIAVFYFLFYVALMYVILWAGPLEVETGRWGPELTYERPLDDILVVQIMGAMLSIPPIVGALAYFSLLRKAETRSQRFRIGAVAGGFVIWFSSGLVASYILNVDTDSPGYRLFTSGLALLASIAVWLAFDPPAWLRKRLGIEAYAAPPLRDDS